ncbi:MAG TPA: hypothetical protein VIP27_10350 [Variovorax sp.]
MAAVFGGMDPSLIVSGIAAVLQAAQTWVAFRDRRRAADTFAEGMAAGTSDAELALAAVQLTSIAPLEVLNALGARTEKCWTNYHEILVSPDGTYMPQEIDEATHAVKLCVCRELRRLRSINGSLPQGKFQQWWDQYGCRP